MHFLTLALSSIAIFFAVTISATPIARQPPSAYYTIVDEELGSAWTLLNGDFVISGNPIGLSAYSTDYIPEQQIWAINQIIEDGNVFYFFQSAVGYQWVSLVQTTSADDYAPGYEMLQTAMDVPSYFTLTPGAKSGSFYMSPVAADGITPQPNLQLSYYAYDSTSTSWIPIIVDSSTGGTSRSFTINSVELEYD